MYHSGCGGSGGCRCFRILADYCHIIMIIISSCGGLLPSYTLGIRNIRVVIVIFQIIIDGIIIFISLNHRGRLFLFSRHYCFLNFLFLWVVVVGGGGDLIGVIS
ncbi:hypothetical protein AGDE_16809 [Angomonas deanei]|nr:hypothetical protein AGDE_16809 [Angomonas deanei]|eukprot:EPY16140.1 hypothetical protein AGDE_16809 [Angomonas deanei]